MNNPAGLFVALTLFVRMYLYIYPLIVAVVSMHSMNIITITLLKICSWTAGGEV